MKLKEKIDHALTMMNRDDLWLLYEQIQMLQQIKQRVRARNPQLSIEDILRMTGSAAGCWSETAQDERRERL